jgi:hypothetical protein
MDKLHLSPADLDAKGKRAGGFVKSNYKKIISAFLLLMILLTMVMDLTVDLEITLMDVGTYATLLTIYILNLVVNADDGKDAGKRDERYIESQAKYKEVVERVISSGRSRYLDFFCRDRREKNLIERRRLVLSRAGIGYGKYLREYIGKEPPEDLPKDKQRAIMEANAMRMETLTPSMLLTAGKRDEGNHIIGEDPKRKYWGTLIVRIISSAILTLIIASPDGSSVSAPTVARVAAGLVKLSSYVVSGYFGYYTGYNHTAVDVASYTVSQTRLLSEADQWIGEREKELEEAAKAAEEDEVPDGLDALTGEQK